ncbi:MULTISPECIES: DUF2339 domain-containing protein [unclassified Pseudomonas]|uniref:DUF2339 domain-containing protein n=1 Tax=unclassified Pseudomonas TaxID=196821 RepID=UPI000D3BB34D|nr:MULTISPECIES: DUF2339 domain-containing protein [unclassified Pseudomonas]RAU46519.1 DUF2339 domain-containing protein [Pseudomonas sp. RIT 409]RAU52468.1 DUF2339 domain-containing protein [Pseudomonas sp. RIT 412]
MQWILLLVGLFFGAVLDESLLGGAVGAVIGLTLGLSIRLSSLSRQAAEHQAQLAQTRLDLQALELRLSQLDSAAAQLPDAPAPAPLLVEPVADNGPELLWDLPDLEPEPAETTTNSEWRRMREAPSASERAHAPAAPNLVDNLLQRAKDWLLGGNTVLRVGVVLLFLGLAFLLRYATEGMVVPIEARYAAVAVSALALMGLGWWLRSRNEPFALMMQGTGVAVLYLTVFAAMKVHTLLAPGMAFSLLVAVTLFSAILALTQNSLALACVAALGGFAAPLLTSSGDGSHVALFSYFALLNTGIFAIAWFKAWRALNLIGFVGTFGIGFAWGLKAYTPALFWSTEPFLILFFLMYLAIGLLFARRKLQEHTTGPENDSREALLRWSASQSHYVDGSLLFGTPIAGFGLQYAIVQHMDFGAAFSALLLGLLYMGIARLLAGRAPGRVLLLVEVCLSLGVVFATLAIPLGLSAQWTTVAWAVEGAAVFWLGMRQNRLLARVFGLLLQLGAGLSYLDIVDHRSSPGDGPGFDHGDFWTPLIISLAALVSAFTVERIGTLRLARSRQALQPCLLAGGALGWSAALCVSTYYVPGNRVIPTLLLLGAISVGLWTVTARRLNWAGLAQLCTLLTPASFVLLGLMLFSPYYHPAAEGGWLVWIAVFAAHLISLKRLDHLLVPRLRTAAHVLGCWLIITVLSLELRHALLMLSESYNAWRWLGWALIPSLYLLAMTSDRHWPWPVGSYSREYRVWAAAPLAAAMLAWFWLANGFSDGAADPLPYLPLINPLELGLAITLVAVCGWTRLQLPQSGVDSHTAVRASWIIAGASSFALITAMVMRSAHHWAEVAWNSEALFDSMRVQAGLSIVWTLTALALMVGGHLRSRRQVWIVGAALIAVVVAKLFFVELSNRGGLERIVSFIGVGILLLVVGYFAPLPPKSPTQSPSPSDETASDSAMP